MRKRIVASCLALSVFAAAFGATVTVPSTYDEETDLAGNPRLRDGKVDIGCYQCWLDPVGLWFSIR